MRDPVLGPRARELRRHLTDAEHLLWQYLSRQQRRGVKFRRQHVLGPYILDFYCVKCRLAVELDGGGHAAQAQVAYDDNRKNFLASRGIRVLRFWNYEVFESVDEVIGAIDATLDSIIPPPALRATSPASGGG